MSGGRRDDAGMDGMMRDFLAARRDSARADADFAGRVMDEVRDWERARAGAGHRARQARPGRSWFAGFPFPFGKPGVGETRPAWTRPALGMAFSCLLLLAVSGLFFIGIGPRGGPDVPDVTRIKGEGFRLGFLLKRGERLSPTEPGMVFLPGDRLQAVYSAPARGRFHLFSLDEAGGIHCFSCAFPDTLLPAGRDRPLSYALELDASRAREVFAGFWSERPITSAAASALLEDAWRAAGRDLDALPESLRRRLSPGLEASLFPIRKQETIFHGNP